MTNATDVIAYLLPRKAAPIVERQTGLPFGWGLWLRALPERLGRITRERADAVVATLAARASDAAPFAPGRWRAFRSLFYQGWGPPPREERWMRWLAGFSSSLLHLLFFLFLLWVALVQIPPPPAEPGDSSRVRLEMIGDGSPAEPGGQARIHCTISRARPDHCRSVGWNGAMTTDELFKAMGAAPLVWGCGFRARPCRV